MATSSSAGKVKVLYHYICPDGVYAAFAAYLRLVKHAADASLARQQVSFVPMTVTATQNEVQHTLETLQATDEVFMLDFSGNFDFLPKACARVSQLHLLDHHKTAAEALDELEQKKALPGNLERVVDMNRSGAMIAFDYFKVAELAPSVHRAFALIQDSDLWHFKLADTKRFNAGLADMAIEYDPNKNPSLFDTLEALDVDAVVARGEALLDEQDRRIKAIIATRQRIVAQAGDHRLSCFAVVVEGKDQGLRSELGNQLAVLSQQEGHAPAAGVITKDPDGRWKFSLRSLGEFDTTMFTKFFGGGGHRNASSCMVDDATMQRILHPV